MKKFEKNFIKLFNLNSHVQPNNLINKLIIILYSPIGLILFLIRIIFLIFALFLILILPKIPIILIKIFQILFG
jgi:hypothetical protein